MLVHRWIVRTFLNRDLATSSAEHKSSLNVMQTRNLKPNVMSVCRLQLKQLISRSTTTTLLQHFLNECSFFIITVQGNLTRDWWPEWGQVITLYSPSICPQKMTKTVQSIPKPDHTTSVIEMAHSTIAIRMVLTNPK